METYCGLALSGTVGPLPTQACGCRLWAVACVASGSGQWRERIRGGTAGPPAWPPAYGVHDDALYKSTAFTFNGCCSFITLKPTIDWLKSFFWGEGYCRSLEGSTSLQKVAWINPTCHLVVWHVSGWTTCTTAADGSLWSTVYNAGTVFIFSYGE